MANPNLNIRIAANIDELRRNLKEGRDQIQTTTAAMEKLASSLDGSKLEQRAHNITAAIEKVGGASKLTTTEAGRMLKPLNDFIAKAEAMGKSVPKDMLATRDALQKVARETDNADKKAGILQSTWAKLSGAFAIGSLIDRGISSIAGGLMNLARGAVESAGNIVDLSGKTGLSITAVQKFGFVAEQSGGSLEQMADTVFKLGVNIETGGKKIENGLAGLGLQYSKIKALKPEDQFDAIMRALAAIESPQERNRIGVDLMGKGYANVAAAVDGYIDAIGQAPTATEAAIKATDDAADAMERAWKRAETAAIDVIGGIAVAWENGDLSRRFEALRFFPGMGMLADLTRPEIKAAVNQSPAGADRVRSVGGAGNVPAAVTPEQQRAIDRLQDAVDKLTGKATTARIAELSQHVALATSRGGIMAVEYDKLGKELSEIASQGFQLPPALDAIRLSHERLIATQKIASLTANHFAQTIARMPAGVWDPRTVANFTEQINSKITNIDPMKIGGGKVLQFPKQGPSASQQYGQKTAQTILAAATGGGNVGVALGAQIGSDLGKKLSEKAGATLNSLFGKTVGGAIASALPGVGALIGPLVGKMFDKIFGSAGRDAVKAFADKMGGFDQLRGTLNKLGDEGERLWINLTQGVGKNNPEQAKRAIEAIEQALAEFEERQQRVQELFGELRGSVDRFGGRGPRALQPMIAELRNMVGLTEEQRRLLDGLAASPSWQSMEAAADRLGVKYEHLGAAFAQAKLSEQALAFVRDLQLLEDGGADLEAVLRDAAGGIQEIVDTAMRTGGHLPETLKPYIQKLIDMKLLLDPDGELITNIDQLSFKDIEDEALNAIKGILEQIRDLLQNQIPNAARAAQAALDGVTPPNAPEHGNPQYDEHGNPNPPPDMATGGIVRARRGGTIVRVGEAGRDEAIVPLPAGGFGMGGGGVTIINDLRGSYVDRMALDRMSDEMMRRMADRLREQKVVA